MVPLEDGVTLPILWMRKVRVRRSGVNLSMVLREHLPAWPQGTCVDLRARALCPVPLAFSVQLACTAHLLSVSVLFLSATYALSLFQGPYFDQIL